QRADLASSVLVGPQATEAKVKELSAKGELKKYRVIAFATHGLLPSEAKGVAEAGLILTPPAQGTAQDDGLLTASEGASLDLDAEWVILSACNTAAGGNGEWGILSACHTAAGRERGGGGRRRFAVWGGRSSTPARARCWCRTGRWRAALRCSSPPARSRRSSAIPSSARRRRCAGPCSRSFPPTCRRLGRTRAFGPVL